MTLYKNILADFNSNFIDFALLIILGQSCLNSIVAMNILKPVTSSSQMIQVVTSVVICMLVNASILAQMRDKTILNLTVSSVYLSVVLIFPNVIILA
jgi:hypothetical protein